MLFLAAIQQQNLSAATVPLVWEQNNLRYILSFDHCLGGRIPISYSDTLSMCKGAWALFWALPPGPLTWWYLSYQAKERYQ